MENGLYLVRESTNYPGDYTLCVCMDGKVEHYRIAYKDNKLTIDEDEYFENLIQLVEVRVDRLWQCNSSRLTLVHNNTKSRNKLIGCFGFSVM